MTNESNDKGSTMNRILFLLGALSLAFAFGGCRSTYVAADGRIAENIALRAMAHNTRSPETGKIYVHKGGGGLKVIQALKGGVLVRPMVGNPELYFRGLSSYHEKMTIYIETPNSYIDDEYLRKGLYEYVGHYTYTAVDGARTTVRKFREVPMRTN